MFYVINEWHKNKYAIWIHSNNKIAVRTPTSEFSNNPLDGALFWKIPLSKVFNRNTKNKRAFMVVITFLIVFCWYSKNIKKSSEYNLFCYRCWTGDSKFAIIQQVPVAGTIILNFLFLINIVRVLVLKLRSGPAHDGQGTGASRSSLQALR